jgi:hypothetical protein
MTVFKSKFEKSYTGKKSVPKNATYFLSYKLSLDKYLNNFLLYYT